MARLTIPCALLLLAMLAACETTTSGGAVGADRRQLMLVSSQQLEQMGAESYARLLADAARKGVLNRDGAMLQRVRAIASRIRPQTAVFRDDAPGWKWEVNVLASDELNAFCLPGGKIMVYSGLLAQLQLTDAEIAVVMGHEIAHALREHSREHVSQAMAADAAIGIGAALFGLGQGSAQLAGAGYEALLATRFSRADETEADRIGLELAARAGYDPRAGAALWRKMIAAGSGGRAPEFLSSHPADSSRVQQIEALLPTVMPLYQAALGRR
ncbi:MAG: peptidase M48 [Betaproteobacteria bacterium RIFCSPLOWO2_12_FULL_65_14]|nr:MAG: peptidase M48 [Betaproteobacteria bacterium RIFCSPLOWO2_12_FULL_65_14]